MIGSVAAEAGEKPRSTASASVGGSARSVVAGAMVDDDEAQPGDVVIEAEGVEFPERVEARAGRIGLLVDNSDAVRHTFLIEGTDVKEELPRNAARRIDVDLAQGEYRIYCDVPGHESMEGTLVVEWGRLTWPPRPTLR